MNNSGFKPIEFFFNQIIDDSPNSIVITDLSGNIVFVNKKFSEITGYTFSEAIGKNPSILKSSIMDHNIFEDLWKSISVGKSWTGNLCNKKKDGTLFWENAKIYSLKGENDQNCYYIGIKTDISQQQYINEQLKLSENKFQYLLDFQPNITIFLSHDYKIISVNSKALEFFQCDYEQVINQPITNFLMIEKLDIMKVLNNHHIKNQYVFKDNNDENEITFSLDVYYYSEKSPLYQIVIKDISKQIEDEARNAKTLLEAKDTILFMSKFLSHISYEIQNPLQSIIGYANLLKEIEIKNPYDNFREKILESSTVLLNLTNDITSLSMIEAGQMKVGIQQTNLNDFISDMQTYFEPKISAKNLQLEIIIQEFLPKLIYIDKLRLKYVLYNLIANAIEYTQKGKITLFVNYLLQKDFLDLEFRIKDTGPGISPEVQNNLFVPKNSFKNDNTSTGLGLAIAKKLTKLLNGEITYTTSNKGTEFVVSLKGILYDSFDCLVSDKQNSTFKILCIDDDQICLIMYKSFLSDKSYSLTFATDGMNGIAEALKVRPNLIIIDYLMPEINGLDFLLKLKDYPVFKDTPVILTSAESNLGNFDLSKTPNYKGFLNKPIRKEELQTIVDLFNKKYLLNTSGKNLFLKNDKKALNKIQLSDKLKNQFLNIKNCLIIENLVNFSECLIEEGNNLKSSDMITIGQQLHNYSELLDITNIISTLGLISSWL